MKEAEDVWWSNDEALADVDRAAIVFRTTIALA